MEQKCTVHFLDVGQGAAAVIVFGKRRGIVIDCAGAAKIPLKVLKRYVDFIDALILSHNDADHAGGAAQILADYCERKAVGQLWFLDDHRPADEIPFWKLCIEEVRKGRLSEPRRLEVPHAVFNEQAIRLDCLAPTMRENVAASSANATSAVLRLTCFNRTAIFAGDAPLKTWEGIHAREGSPISCEALLIPHHGGQIDPSPNRRMHLDRYSGDGLRWFFTQAVKAKVALISVGTSNTYGHPRPEVVDSARRSGATIVCTEITKQCCKHLNSLSSGVVKPSGYSLSGVSNAESGNGSAAAITVACGGSVTVTLGQRRVIWGSRTGASGVCGFKKLDEHQKLVDALRDKPGCNPLCRRGLS